MLVRGIRGATTVEANSVEAILEATRELLEAMLKANEVDTELVASAFFTTTPDLTAEFPALAARDMVGKNVALMCGHEMNKPGALQMCLRILLHVNTEKAARDIKHVYMRGATVLRPDISTEIDEYGSPTG
jgi:chorismate mutase